MYYLYILQSRKYKKLYIGSTYDLKRRLIEHIKGQNKSTKYGMSWKLVYYEAFLSKSDVLNRERSLKKYSGAYRQLKKRIKSSLDRT